MAHATHANAALTPCARLRLGRLIVHHGWSPARAAERYDDHAPHRQEVGRPLPRRRARGHVRPVLGAAPAAEPDAGARGPQDRPPAPEAAAWDRSRSPTDGMASSTVHAVLVRCWINRLTHIDRATGEPIRRYEHEHPGDLIDVDVKLAASRRGGVTPPPTRPQEPCEDRDPNRCTDVKYRQPLIGTCYRHIVIDDRSRVAYVEAHDDETKETSSTTPNQLASRLCPPGSTSTTTGPTQRSGRRHPSPA